MTYDEIVQGLRDSTYELENEGRLVRAGLKTEQDTAAIIERYAWLYSADALAVVSEPADEAQKRVRAALLQGIIWRRTAPQEDRLTTFYAEASAPVGEEQMPFYTAQAQLVTEAEDLNLELNATVLQVIHEQGFGGYLPFWSSLKEIDYAPLEEELVRVADAA